MTMHAPPNHQPGMIEQTRNTVVSSAQDTATAVHETVDHYPISSALVVFGVGLGAGVLIGCALADSSLPSLTSSRSTGNTAEAFGQRVLDGIAGIMPDAISSHLNRKS